MVFDWTGSEKLWNLIIAWPKGNEDSKRERLIVCVDKFWRFSFWKRSHITVKHSGQVVSGMQLTRLQAVRVAARGILR